MGHSLALRALYSKVSVPCAQMDRFNSHRVVPILIAYVLHCLRHVLPVWNLNVFRLLMFGIVSAPRPRTAATWNSCSRNRPRRLIDGAVLSQRAMSLQSSLRKVQRCPRTAIVVPTLCAALSELNSSSWHRQPPLGDSARLSQNHARQVHLSGTRQRPQATAIAVALQTVSTKRSSTRTSSSMPLARPRVMPFVAQSSSATFKRNTF
mmetsp:Transcript_19443/g.57878  ORF Transcript_19443/g.57878 Transcript_19443/m.57878 type:complete len:207 (+) Transcript_19443:5657-6277(+)